MVSTHVCCSSDWREKNKRYLTFPTHIYITQLINSPHHSPGFRILVAQ